MSPLAYQTRKIINVAYLALAVARGLTAAITDPTVPEIQTTLLACDLLMGRDEYSMRWILAYRKRSEPRAGKSCACNYAGLRYFKPARC